MQALTVTDACRASWTCLINFIFIGAPIKTRESRDLMRILKEAGNALRQAGETALRTILPKVINSGILPGTRSVSQKTTQPFGPKIPLNAINEDSIRPVIPFLRKTLEPLEPK